MKDIFSRKDERLIFNAQLEDDRVKLFVNAEKKAADSVTVEELLALLAEFMDVKRAERRVLDDIVADLNAGKKVERRRIAAGKSPGEGIDGKVVLLVKKLSAKGEIAVDEKGFAKFKELHLFDNIQEKQIVARLYPPKAGEPGEDAFGNQLPGLMGKEAVLDLDASLKLEADPDPEKHYKIVVAQKAGYVGEDKSGKLHISELLTVEGDLGLKVGNIDFIGRVKITGDIQGGFEVRGRTGVEVNGGLRGGKIVSSEGDVIIKGVAFGPNAKIESAKQINVKSAQQLDAHARGDILVQRDAHECQLRSEAAIQMGSAEIVGGEAFAVCGIEAKLIGNETGIKTVLHLCGDVETSPEFERLTVQIHKHNQARDLIKLHLGPFADKPHRIELLKPEHREKMQRFTKKLADVSKSLENLEKQRAEMLEHARYSAVARVNVKSKFFTGAEIHAGDALFTAPETIEGQKTIEYNRETKVFEVVALKALECSVTPPPSGGTNDKPK